MFPSHFRHIHVIPLLNDSPLPANNLTSYRPISNLSFISKLLDKNVSCRLNLHCNHLSNVFQFAYKQFHSTKNALPNIHNDIAVSMDIRKVTALTPLDLSAPFDTID